VKTTCPNIGTCGHGCSLCGQFHYTAMQLPMYETCDICGLLVFGATTGLPIRSHRACGEAIERWVRSDNVAYLRELGMNEHGYRYLTTQKIAT
jgi:hypothetical protein